MKTPEPYDTPDGVAVDIGTLYRYDTRRGIRYILSGFREAGSPRGFFITRDEVLTQIAGLLDRVDERATSKPSVRGRASKKWTGQ